MSTWQTAIGFDKSRVMEEPQKARLRWVSFVIGSGIAVVAVAVTALWKLISR
jgi:hypothetical protein